MATTKLSSEEDFMKTSHAHYLRSKIMTGKYLARANFRRSEVLAFTRRHRTSQYARYAILNGYYSEAR